MHTCIFQNSYIVAVLVFILLYVLFYFFGINPIIQEKNGKIVKKTNWKIPLAISLIVWLIWYFYLFPPSAQGISTTTNSNNVNVSCRHLSNKPLSSQIGGFIPKTKGLDAQKINMVNWM